ncbi:MAG: L-glutamate gamma-semialdehyde dehydrogenase [Bacillota bacterium]
MLNDFTNEPFVNFSVQANREAMEKAITAAEQAVAFDYPLVINGESIFTENKISSLNPSRIEQVVGRIAAGDQELAEKAMQAALDAFDSWSRLAPEERARYLFKAAAIIRRRKFALAAAMILEVGKNWAEADADVAEAIDFLEFYGREALRLAERQPLTRLVGEDNELYYIPLGVGVIISPWNFPLAILAGMAAGPLVMGNTVIMKPASNAPVIASKFMEIMQEAGLPPGVMNLLPGSGAAVGDYLVRHPKTRFINFTGSREVGLKIAEQGGKISAGQIWIKRVSAEMGGKDAIIVDREADLEAAVDGIITSAFGFQGQKCSACSRAIIDKAVYDQVAEGVVARTKQIVVGPVKDFGNYLGPVIDQAAMDKILGYIKIGKQEGKLLCGGNRAREDGYFVEPTVFGAVSPKARIAREEIFGPVLALIKAEHFDEALLIANDTEYGLTGAVYSGNRAKLEQARREFFVGNLYFNRKCTGAMVGAQPFGGYNMSGTCAKAGGRDYLLLFSQAKLVAEKM